MNMYLQTTPHLFEGYFFCNPTFLEQRANFSYKGPNSKLEFVGHLISVANTQPYYVAQKTAINNM